MANISVQHPPAVKIGGRRLSISTRHKTHGNSGAARSEKSPSPEANEEDYPRPAAPGEEPHQHILHNEEELPPKKEKKHGNHENERKLKEFAHWKVDITRPTRDLQGGNKSFGASGRIAQPAGKGLGV